MLLSKHIMYNFLNQYLDTKQIVMAGILFSFLLTFFTLKHPFSFLPSDQGREFAVNGALSKGKLRGVGLIFVITFLIGTLLFMPIETEFLIYAVLLVLIMLSGYFDDASKIPWNEYKKGLIDLVISVIAVVTFLN